MQNDGSTRATLMGAACLLLLSLPVTHAETVVQHPAVQPALMAPATPADPQSSREGASAAEEMTHLQEDTVLLKAQLKRLDAQTEVAERSAALNRLGGGVGALEQIQVVAIEGLGRKMQATLQLPDGGQFDVAPGDTLPNGIRIASIEAKSVTLERHGEKPARLLLAASQANPARNPAQSYSAYPMPSLSSLPFPKD